jgi:crotonobetainyl-CoA:carnitine CoA-transferase CaiB-like acyl-CoA transferase
MAEGRSSLPLADLRVVALEQAVSAPFATRQLADMGANVVKIERPDGGDPARAYDDVAGGTSAYFAWLNRGKKSVVLDLKTEMGRASCQALIDRADVLVHNLAPGAVERLGFGYENLSKRVPPLVWCGISGYGPDGPYRDKKAYDMLVQAESGVISLTGSVAEPAKVGVSIADIASGLYAYSSILAALLKRWETGRGSRIDISMLECLTEWVMPPIHAWQGTGRAPGRVGARHNMIVPYGAYACADGPVMFAIQNDREWVRFCDSVLEDPAVAGDERYRTNAARLANRSELEHLVETRLRAMTRGHALSRLDGAGIATGEVRDVAQVVEHPQLRARGRWRSARVPGGEIAALVPPHNIVGCEPLMGDVPALGQHTASVLAETSTEGDRT